MSNMRSAALLVVGALLIVVAACDDEQTCQPVAPDSANQPPSIPSLGDTSIVLGDTLRANLLATDPDRDELTYHTTTLLHDASETGYVADAHMDPNTGDFWFAPRTRDRPNRSILITAVDEHGYSVSTQVDVTVTYYVDQENDPGDQAHGPIQNVRYFAPIGQEFVPNLSALEIVEVWLNGSHGELIARIRPDTMIGPVLATSDTLSVPGGFKGFACFEFDRLSLIPQQRYVFEIVLLSGPDWLIGTVGPTYPLGRQILRGQPVENNDLWFREGAKAPRPPEVLSGSALNRHSVKAGSR